MRAKGAWPRRSILAAPPSARVAWVGPPGEKGHSVQVGTRAQPAVLPWRFLDAIAVDEDRVVAAIVAGTEKKPTAKLVMGRVPEREGETWEKELELPKAVKVEWPDPLVWAKAPWSKRAGLGLAITITKSRFGVAIAEKDSGLVCVMGPDAKGFDFALRVPTQDEATIYATATQEGVLVVVCIEGRESGACHFTREGRPIASLKKLAEDTCRGMGPAVVVGGTRALVVSGYSAPKLFCLELPTLRELSSSDLGAEIAGDQSAEAAEDGKVCVVGVGGEAWVARLDEEDEWEASRLPVATSATGAAQPFGAGAERVKGPPALTLVPQREAARVWSAKPGQTLDIELAFASTGGAGNGVYFELSGPWIATGKIRPVAVVVGQTETPFSAAQPGVMRVDIPGIELAAAALPPPDAKKNTPVPATAMFATLRLEAKESGADLLSMRIGPLSAKVKGAGSFAYSKRVEVGE